MMNFNFNDVEKYLRDGGDPKTIADAFATKLNTALKAIDAEDELWDAKEALLDAWNDYVEVYFNTHNLPDGTVLEDWYLDENELDTIMETLVKTIPLINKYAAFVEDINKTVKGSTKTAKIKADDVISKFFNKYDI